MNDVVCFPPPPVANFAPNEITQYQKLCDNLSKKPNYTMIIIFTAPNNDKPFTLIFVLLFVVGLLNIKKNKNS